MAQENMFSNIILVLALLVVFGVSYIALSAQHVENINVKAEAEKPQIEKNSIEVIGTSQKNVQPDLLVIELGAETEDKDAATAEMKNAEIIGAVKKALIAKGIPESNIKTSYYNVEIVKNWSANIYPAPIVGYNVVHMLSINVDDATKGGEIIDVAISAGANRVDSVYFTLKDETKKEIEKQLLMLASQHAKEKANAIAKGLNVNISKLIVARESVYFPTPVYRYGYFAEAGAGAPSVATDISPGQLKVSATVSVSFEVDQ